MQNYRAENSPIESSYVNPYASPLAVTEQRPTPKSLFSDKQVGIVTFLFSLLAGCGLLALNYARMGRGGAAAASVIVGALFIAALISLGMVIELSSFANIVINILVALTMKQTAKVLQGQAVNDHVAQGGQIASVWLALAIGLLGLLATVAIIVGVIAAGISMGWLTA